MGHIRLGVLPKSRKWKQVVGLIAGGADVEHIAAASADAAENGLDRASRFSIVNGLSFRAVCELSVWTACLLSPLWSRSSLHSVGPSTAMSAPLADVQTLARWRARGGIGGALFEAVRAAERFEHVVAFSRSTSPSIERGQSRTRRGAENDRHPGLGKQLKVNPGSRYALGFKSLSHPRLAPSLTA